MGFFHLLSWIACCLSLGVVAPDPEGVNTSHSLCRPRDTSFYGCLNCPSSYASNVNACMYYVYIYVY